MSTVLFLNKNFVYLQIIKLRLSNDPFSIVCNRLYFPWNAVRIIRVLPGIHRSCPLEVLAWKYSVLDQFPYWLLLLNSYVGFPVLDMFSDSSSQLQKHWCFDRFAVRDVLTQLSRIRWQVRRRSYRSLLTAVTRSFSGRTPSVIGLQGNSEGL